MPAHPDQTPPSRWRFWKSPALSAQVSDAAPVQKPAFVRADLPERCEKLRISLTSVMAQSLEQLLTKEEKKRQTRVQRKYNKGNIQDFKNDIDPAYSRKVRGLVTNGPYKQKVQEYCCYLVNDADVPALKQVFEDNYPTIKPDKVEVESVSKLGNEGDKVEVDLESELAKLFLSPKSAMGSGDYYRDKLSFGLSLNDQFFNYDLPLKLIFKIELLKNAHRKKEEKAGSNVETDALDDEALEAFLDKLEKNVKDFARLVALNDRDRLLSYLGRPVQLKQNPQASIRASYLNLQEHPYGFVDSKFSWIMYWDCWWNKSADDLLQMEVGNSSSWLSQIFYFLLGRDAHQFLQDCGLFFLNHGKNFRKALWNYGVMNSIVINRIMGNFIILLLSDVLVAIIKGILGLPIRLLRSFFNQVLPDSVHPWVDALLRNLDFLMVFSLYLVFRIPLRWVTVVISEAMRIPAFLIQLPIVFLVKLLAPIYRYLNRAQLEQWRIQEQEQQEQQRREQQEQADVLRVVDRQRRIERLPQLLEQTRQMVRLAEERLQELEREFSEYLQDSVQNPEEDLAPNSVLARAVFKLRQIIIEAGKDVDCTIEGKKITGADLSAPLVKVNERFPNLLNKIKQKESFVLNFKKPGVDGENNHFILDMKLSEEAYLDLERVIRSKSTQKLTIEWTAGYAGKLDRSVNEKILEGLYARDFPLKELKLFSPIFTFDDEVSGRRKVAGEYMGLFLDALIRNKHPLQLEVISFGSNIVLTKEILDHFECLVTAMPSLKYILSMPSSEAKLDKSLHEKYNAIKKILRARQVAAETAQSTVIPGSLSPSDVIINPLAAVLPGEEESSRRRSSSSVTSMFAPPPAEPVAQNLAVAATSSSSNLLRNH